MKELTEPGTFIAIAAFIVSLLAFRQSRKLPNENKIFEEKIRVYHEFIKVMNAAVNEIFGCINEFAENEKTKAIDRKELEDDLNSALDDAIYSFEDAITDNALIIPDKLVDKLSNFLEFLDKDEYLKTYASPGKFEKLEEEIDDAFNRIIDDMRNDLDFDILNKGLRKRMKGNKRLRFLNKS
jgi:Txe/YoeB family toxin of Txe-Axe toxin-antitoxin module